MIDFAKYKMLNSVQRGAVLELMFLHRVSVQNIKQINRYLLFGRI